MTGLGQSLLILTVSSKEHVIWSGGNGVTCTSHPKSLQR